MLRLFYQSNPLTFFLLIVYAILINLKWLISPVALDPQQYSYISNIIFNNWLHVGNWSPVLIICINATILTITGIFFSFLLQQYKIITKASLIPAVVFITLCSFFPDFLHSIPEVVCGMLLVFILFKIFGVYNKTKADNTYFDTGLLTGITSLLYFPAILFCVFGMFSLFRMRSTSFREFFIFCLGVLVSYFLVGTVLFWYDVLPEFLTAQFSIPKSMNMAAGAFGVISIVKLSLIGAALVVSLVYYSNRFSANLIQVRKYLGAFVLLFIFSTGAIFMHYPLEEGGLFFAIVAASVFISYFFYHSKNRLTPELMYLGLVGTTLIFQYINFAA